MLYNIDVNQMNQLMEENETAQQIIRQLLENHHMIIRTISHEIRNPLTLISSSLQIMQIQHPEVQSFPHWKQTLHDVDFMRKLLEELSSLNSVDDLHYSVFSMEQILKNIAISFAISLDREHSPIQFSASISPTLGNFTGDRIKLEEVFLNLLKNAADAIHENGKILFKASRQKDRLMITIEDNGCGIPEEYLESIFEPFKTYKPEGTGLGLFLSQRIVEAHNGTISVTSTEKSGTVFSVEFPV